MPGSLVQKCIVKTTINISLDFVLDIFRKTTSKYFHVVFHIFLHEEKILCNSLMNKANIV